MSSSILGFPPYLVVPKAPLDLVSAIYAKLPLLFVSPVKMTLFFNVPPCAFNLTTSVFDFLWHIHSSQV